MTGRTNDDAADRAAGRLGLLNRASPASAAAATSTGSGTLTFGCSSTASAITAITIDPASSITWPAMTIAAPAMAPTAAAVAPLTNP